MKLSRLIVALGLVGTLHADEGMWTFDRAPIEAIQKRYGFTITKDWLDRVRLSSVRFNDGGSGSFVSADGLVLTNHHVALDELEKLSTPQKNYAADGFYARTRADEMRAVDSELNVLMSSENVTAQVAAAVRGKTGQAALDARRAEIARIEKDSLDRTGLRSDVVALYHNAEYWLYRYKKYTDVRLVFAPEQQAAFFGGDPDNFTFPRHDLDFALFRVYENGQPVRPEHFLTWNERGATDDELVFVSGHPGTTDREDTVAELETERDTIFPADLSVIRRRLGVLRQYAGRGPEEARQAAGLIFSLENSLKAIAGEYDGLRDPRVMAKKAAEERALRDAIAKRSEWQKQYARAWDDLLRAEQARRKLYMSQRFGQLRGSSLASLGFTIVRYVTEVRKPDGVRLDGYHDSQLQSLLFQLTSARPFYPALEETLLADALQQSLEELGPAHPFVKAAIGGRTPAEAAAESIRGTRLADAALRKQLVDGGETAVAQSTDPLIALGRAVDPIMRDITKSIERDVDSVKAPAREKVGQARFAVYGSSAYPDATFTLRLSYGKVAGYPMNGTKAPYKTTFAGLIDRSASFDHKPPFHLTPRLEQARARLDLTTPLNFVTTNDIIGGNSGSPVVNRNGELVGLIFDGNIESLVGRFVYEEERNRAIAVHAGAIVHALRVVYDAGALAEELTQVASR